MHAWKGSTLAGFRKERRRHRKASHRDNARRTTRSQATQWQCIANPRSTNQRCDSQNLYIVVGLSVAYYANRKIILFLILLRILLQPHPRKMPHATRRISSACFDVYDAFTSAYTTLSVKHSIAVKSEQN